MYIEDIKQPYLRIGLPQAPMYFTMVEDMLEMTKLQHGSTLECKWEPFKKFHSHVQTNVFRLRRYLA